MFCNNIKSHLYKVGSANHNTPFVKEQVTPTCLANIIRWLPQNKKIEP